MHGVFEFGNGNTKELQQTANFFAGHSFISERRLKLALAYSLYEIAR
jgi:hypothetical protein